MTAYTPFERSHSIEITATGAAVLDYVSNPNSWPEWIAASHQIESEDRPLVKGDRFREMWATRTGEVELNWTVTDSAPGRLWVGEAETDFIGRIVVRYDIAPVAGGVRFTRTVQNPTRRKPPTDDMIRRIDDEAGIALANIKRAVERSAGAA